ncbi:Uncharacterised protein [Sphingobacterium mizutaii]|uniref:Uncharacterized protein n=1 Tax=Sphingobacterium mizutaii TaxID=1010 RepID=A0AAJ4XCM1_9SPHI|nr:hypothetical protein SAMN05192578_1011367 [Sphingobacterium mizutaii]SNV51639.1 Uncharacterised protein [Sphingobacterium mizutaii]
MELFLVIMKKLSTIGKNIYLNLEVTFSNLSENLK